MYKLLNGVQERFSVPIYVGQLDDRQFDIIRNAVIKYIDLNRHKFTAPSGWNCPTLSNIELSEDDYGDDGALKTEIEAAMRCYYEAWQFKLSNLQIESTWINIARKGAYQEFHDHLHYLNDRLFSGVLYIKASKEQGHIQLRNPLSSYAHCMLPSDIFDDFVIEPQDGRLVCFPAWMTHCVRVNTTDEERISVAWNAVVKRTDVKRTDIDRAV